MSFYQTYSDTLHQQLSLIDTRIIDDMVTELLAVWTDKRRVFICGNGGSAANANHIANDLIYGVNPGGRALDVEAITANPSVLTCLANDVGYKSIFSHQLMSKAKAGDVLIVLSGSGNSANIVEALVAAKEYGMTSYALVGYNGGEAKNLADHVVHCNIDDMQIAEDIQVVIGHWLMRQLNQLMTKQR